MTHRFVKWCAAALAAGAVGAAACIDMSAPGVASISTLLLPSPSVVIGDVMRDSVGAPAPLRVVAFSGSGDTLTGQTTTFVVLDSGAHVDATGLLHGDGVRDSLPHVRVIGSVGTLQTPPITVIVARAPDTVGAVAAPGTLTAKIGVDSTQNQSDELAVLLRSASRQAVEGFIVRYRVLYSPLAIAGALPVAYVGDAGRTVLTDTTDAGGRASRRAYVRVTSIGDAALASGSKSDSIVVEATVQYKGTLVRGAPVHFMIPLKISVTATP